MRTRGLIRLVCSVFRVREMIRLAEPSFEMSGVVSFPGAIKYLIRDVIKCFRHRHALPNLVSNEKVICDSGLSEKARRSHLEGLADNAIYISKSTATGWPGFLEFSMACIAFVPVCFGALVAGRGLRPASNIWTWFSSFSQASNIINIAECSSSIYLYGLHQPNHNWIVGGLGDNVTSVTSDTPLSYHSGSAICHNLLVSQQYQLEEVLLLDDFIVKGTVALKSGHSNYLPIEERTSHVDERYGVIISSSIWLRCKMNKPFDLRARKSVEHSLLASARTLMEHHSLDKIYVSLHPSELAHESSAKDFYEKYLDVTRMGPFSRNYDMILKAKVIVGGFTTTSFDLIKMASELSHPPLISFVLTEEESKMEFAKTSVSKYFFNDPQIACTRS